MPLFLARHFAQYGGSGVFAIGIEGGDEAASYEVEYMLLGIGKSTRGNACGDDGVVVGNLGVVKHLLRLLQSLARKPFDEFGVW